jgi:signal transduction histidine kinase
MTPDGPVTPEAPSLDWLSLGGEMGERTRAFDWSKTPVGPAASWPQSLKTALAIMLTTRYPMLIWWGKELLHFYNDAYLPVLGQRHPVALGRPAPEVWSEAWPLVGPQAEAVMREGKSYWNEELLIVMTRNGYPEEVYMTFSYGPILDDAGRVGGVFCACTEETQRVLGRRRLRTLGALAERASAASTVEEACEIAARAMLDNPHDVPFALLYLLDEGQEHLTLAGAVGLGPDTPASPARAQVHGGSAPWPFAEAMKAGRGIDAPLTDRWGPLPGGPWPEPAAHAVVLPIAKPGQTRLAGFAVVGVSPRRPLDEAYRRFVELVAQQIGTAVANARAYEEERRRAEALAELDRAKTTFFSNVSHEFRTPLTLILGPLEELLGSGGEQVGTQAKGQLAVVHRNSLRLLKLVNTMLDFSRLEAGRMRASHAPTALSEYTAELASMFRAAIERAGLRLEVDCRPLPGPVYVDRDMWEKIVLNLLSNAFKFTLEGEISVRLEAVGEHVQLTVRDTGVGIPSEELPRVFERFHRVKDARGRTHEGTGIGLALVQELVRLHGGSLTVESTLAKGSQFTVRLPLGMAHLEPAQVGTSPGLAPAPIGADAFVQEALRWLPEGEAWPEARGARLLDETDVPEGAAPLPAAARARVLWADDNADMRAYVTRLLGARFEVTAVADGQAALEAARAEPPDVVLCDVMMPRLDGTGLLRELRADPRLRETPVILLSARAGEESRIEGLKRGADDYLVKPFSARELLARLETQVERARARAALRKSEERFRALVTASSDLLYWMSPDWSQRRGLSGRGLRTGTFPSWEAWPDDALLPEDREQVLARINEAIRTRSPFELEHRILRADGSVGWILSRAVPLLDEQGAVVEWFGAASDISARKTAEKERERAEALEQVDRVQRVLVAEIQHRSRNLLAVVRAMVAQTLRSSGSLEEAEARIADRLAALSRVHALLSRSEAPSITVGELVRMELEATVPGTTDRILIRGPEVTLPVQAVRTFSLALHELATNAVKYGALTRQGQGRVEVTWDVREGRWLVLAWNETGVPLRPAPGRERRGFGRELIEQALPYELDARTQLDIGENGVHCTIELPLEG